MYIPVVPNAAGHRILPLPRMALSPHRRRYLSSFERKWVKTDYLLMLANMAIFYDSIRYINKKKKWVMFESIEMEQMCLRGRVVFYHLNRFRIITLDDIGAAKRTLLPSERELIGKTKPKLDNDKNIHLLNLDYKYCCDL